MKAKSLWYTKPRTVEVRDVEVGSPGPHEVLVKVAACGVCTWDLFIFSGGFQEYREFPFYFGHEGVGTIEAVGEGVSRVAVGDRVALRESAVIGANGRGHMAELALQSENEVIPLPKDGRVDELWMIEPVACCVNAVDLSRIQAGARVALVGCGFMGSIILQLLAMQPVSEIAVLELRPELLAYARSVTGAPITVYDLGEKPDFTKLRGTFDVVIETAAVEAAFTTANALTRKGGTLVIFSWQHHPFTFDFGDWHVRGITVLNASPAAAPDFTRCFHQSAALMAAGRVDLSPLVTHVARPEDAQPLYEHGLAKTDGYIKGVIRWV